jgi:large subunit ribosomal protein L10
MMTRETKAQEITDISEKFGRSKAAFLVDFKGMDVESVTKLRKSLRPVESEMRVVRNTLARRALEKYPEMKAALGDQFTGTNAIIFVYGEAAASAKALSNFGKDVEAFQLKVGVMDGQALDEAKIKVLATLPSKQELQAKLLGTMQAPMQKFLGTLQAVPGGFARVLQAYADTKAE